MIDIYIIKFVSIGIYTRECQPFPFLLLGFQNSISLERENTKILIYTNSVSILEFFSINDFKILPVSRGGVPIYNTVFHE